MSIPPDNSDLHSIIAEFKPVTGQWELNDENIKRVDPQTGETILHNYCKFINTTPVRIFKHLIETHSVDGNTLDKSQNTPIYHAFDKFDPNNGGDIAILAYLLTQKDVNANITNQNGRILLHFACIKINFLPLDMFKLLIETHNSDVNLLDKTNNTPIHFATQCFDPKCGGDLTTLTYLLTHERIIINTKDEGIHTLFHAVTVKFNYLPIEIFKWFVETKGCNLNLLDNYGYTPLYYAVRYYNPKHGGDMNILTYLLNHDSVDVNAKNKKGGNLLHFACENISSLPLDVFKYLIEVKGANIHALEMTKTTPIHTALTHFEPEPNEITVLTYLFSQNGINVNTKNPKGRTLLHLACEQINYFPIAIFKDIIEKHNADVKIQDRAKNTPIHDALRCFRIDEGGDIATLIYLLSLDDVNANTQNQKGYSLLHLACLDINTFPLEVFKCLIENGADVNLLDRKNNTPLFFAVRNFMPQLHPNDHVLVYLLNQNGFNTNILSRGRTLLHLACTLDFSGGGAHGNDGSRPRKRQHPPTSTEIDDFWSSIIDVIAKGRLQQVLDGTTF
jgi:ankyrin repeat protein